MIKIKVSYQDESEKDRILRSLKKDFNIRKISKEIQGQYKRLYLSLE